VRKEKFAVGGGSINREKRNPRLFAGFKKRQKELYQTASSKERVSPGNQKRGAAGGEPPSIENER